MKHPPYHLRVNKEIDRFLLVEIIGVLKEYCGISDYTYYGFGGPFLQDCRLIHSRCPEIKIVSIERDEDTFKRQKFHSFSKNLDLIYEDFDNFVANSSSNGREIFWLDYTNLELGHFDDFKSILRRVSGNSVVKITVPAETPSNVGAKNSDSKWETFQEIYDEVLPSTAGQGDIERTQNFINLLQEMIQMASQQAFSDSGESTFQLLNSSYYKDSTRMLGITGIVCNKDRVSEIRKWFKGWKFANLDWGAPRKISVPTLSIKERLYLEKYLPTTKKTGLALSRVLGYRIDEGEEHIEQLKQYEEFHQYYPYFTRVSF